MMIGVAQVMGIKETVRSFFLDILDFFLRQGFCRLKREDRADDGCRRTSAGNLQETPARQLIPSKDRPFHGGLYRTIEEVLGRAR